MAAWTRVTPAMYIPKVRCVDCGRFVSGSDMRAHCDFTPLNEFGPEQLDWTCGRCAEKTGLLDIMIAEGSAE